MTGMRRQSSMPTRRGSQPTVDPNQLYEDLVGYPVAEPLIDPLLLLDGACQERIKDIKKTPRHMGHKLSELR
jgi:hypothetical protein